MGQGGVIRDILLDHREQLVQSEIEKGVITFMYPLVIIIFKPLKFPRFYGLAEEEIPLSIASKSAPLWGTMFHYQQYTLTPGYVFTLNKGQGQTSGSMIVDL